MSASAGRILLLPKGAYDANTTYNLLDMVFYQGSTYVAKQTTTGNLPTNTTYWQILAQGTQSAQVAGNYYGTCDTAAATAAKVVTIPAIENFVLQIGDIIGVKFDYDNSANNVTLNVNNTGAKHIYYNNAQLTTDNLFAGGEEDRITVYMYDGTNWVWIGHDIDEAGSSTGGVPIRLIVESEEGSTVTITLPDGVTTVTAIHMAESGHWYYDFYGPEAYGTYRIDAVLNGDDSVAYQTVDNCGIYVIDDSHFHANITVTYPTGATVTCSKSGETTQYASGSPYTFVVHSTGTYTIEGTRNGITETHTVTITTDGQTESVTLTILPDGSTITPTDDVQKLLQCADIWNKTTYTTIAQVINDTDVLLKVLTTDNSIDYLVRSTTFASDICADEDAMSMIGAYDYCADTLLTDSTWASAIGGSTYKLKVANVSVPPMTSANTPSGEAYSNSLLATGYEAWRAFDGIETNATAWMSANTKYGTDAYLQYTFANKKKIYFVDILEADPQALTESNVNAVTLTVEGLDDNNTWNTIMTQAMTKADALIHKIYYKSNPSSYNSYRAYFSGTNVIGSSTQRSAITVLNFLGRENGGIQSWLKAGGITDKTYMTLAEVLADATTLNALLSDNDDAYDYLVTAYGLVDGIVADSTAMGLIGLDNYGANKLLLDSVWLNAIVNSTYRSSVLNTSIPTMTSNTTPSGEAFAISGSSDPAYMAFDNNASTWWGGPVSNAWVAYDFGQPVKVCMADWWTGYAGDQRTKTYKVEATNDKTGVWTTLYEGVAEHASVSYEIKNIINSANSYRYWRMFIVDHYMTSNYGIIIPTLQFYGRQDV